MGLGIATLLLSAQRVLSADASAVQANSSYNQTEPSEQQIPAEEFISSPFAEYFEAGDYKGALASLDVLAEKYPEDPLIIRYRAIVLDRLGRYDEALKLYDRLLSQDINHIPTRFFRAQTYARKGDTKKAIEELKWTVSNSETSEYRDWAEEYLKGLEASARAARPVKRKRFYLFGNIGWEYDTNVPLKSNDSGVGFGSDKNAGRFPLNLGLGYQVIQKPKLRFDAIYTARQSFNDDGLDEFNFTSQELAFDLRKTVSWWDRDVTLGLRYDFVTGFLDRDIFSLANRWRLSSDVKLTPRTRTYFYNRFGVSDFGPDGSNPPQTSRDGFEYQLGLTQYFYSSDYRSYVFLGTEFDFDQTRGANFTRRGGSGRIGLHVPVSWIHRTDLDTSGGFNFGEYPRFESLSRLDPNQRLDNNWDYYLSLTYRLTPRMSIRTFYRYINANNRNDFYQYDRQITGVHYLFTQYF
ncbi:MAG: tetratricopeptide repeat protein [Nitrososphaera sp.]|nr:tetratricopeptide repeat protein [Nitrososphaera sp.]